MFSKSLLRHTLWMGLLFSLGACTSLQNIRKDFELHGEDFLDVIMHHPHPHGPPVYCVYLVGDGGEPRAQDGSLKPAIEMLGVHLDGEDSRSAVVFLGDNIYPSGMPEPSSNSRQDAENRILDQLEAIGDFPGEVVFVPGNHDWGNDGRGGSRARVQYQEAFVEESLGRGNTFLPDSGQPGPVAVELSDSLTLIALDTQWWLELFTNRSEDFESRNHFLAALDSTIASHSDDDIIVAAHHPVFTNGHHGGFDEEPSGVRGRFHGIVRQQVRRTPLGRQDVTHPTYHRLAEGLLDVFAQHDGIIYAAGHEHSLQYFHHDEQHHIVSGSLSKQTYLEQGHGMTYGHDGYGFAVVRYYDDDSVWMEFWIPEDDNPYGHRVFHARIEPYISESEQ